MPAFRYLRKVQRAEFWLAVITAVGVLTVGVLQGILVAVMLSLVNVLCHLRHPHDALLDDVDASGGTVYREVSDKETALTEPGLIVYRFDAPLVVCQRGVFYRASGRADRQRRRGIEMRDPRRGSLSVISNSTAAEALENLDADMERRSLELWVARANATAA